MQYEESVTCCIRELWWYHNHNHNHKRRRYLLSMALGLCLCLLKDLKGLPMLRGALPFVLQEMRGNPGESSSVCTLYCHEGWTLWHGGSWGWWWGWCCVMGVLEKDCCYKLNFSTSVPRRYLSIAPLTPFCLKLQRPNGQSEDDDEMTKKREYVKIL